MGRSWLSPDPPCLLGHLIPITVLSRTNALDTWDSTYFKHCRYDPHSSPYCPVFRIGDLVAMAGGDFEDLALLVSPLGQSSCSSGLGSHAHLPGEQKCVVCRVVLWPSESTGTATWTPGALTAVPSTPSSCRRGTTTSGMALAAIVLACCSWPSTLSTNLPAATDQSTPNSDRRISAVCARVPQTCPVPSSLPSPLCSICFHLTC